MALNTKPKEAKLLKSKDLDVGEFRPTITTVNKAELEDDFATIYSKMEALADTMTPKRVLRIYKKALAAPVMPDALIPLKNDQEQHLFALSTMLRDRGMAIMEIMYEELKDEERKVANE